MEVLGSVDDLLGGIAHVLPKPGDAIEVEVVIRADDGNVFGLLSRICGSKKAAGTSSWSALESPSMPA